MFATRPFLGGFGLLLLKREMKSWAHERWSTSSRRDEMTSSGSITVAILTYGRDQVLVSTIRHVLALDPPPAEVIVLDQTEECVPEVTRTLEEWHFLQPSAGKAAADDFRESVDNAGFREPW